MTQEGDELPIRGRGEVAHRGRFRALRGDPVDPAVGSVPIRVGVGVGRPPVVPVGDVEGAVGTERHVAGGEPGVVGPQDVRRLAGPEGGTQRRDLVAADRVTEQVGRDVPAAPPGRPGVGLVEEAAGRDVAPVQAVVPDVVEVSIRVRVVKRPVLAERLPVVASLDAVEHHEPAHVGAGEEPAVRVEVQAPHVAAALAEELEAPGTGVIAPDALLELDAADPGRDGRPLQAVEPAVRAPGERVGHRVGVFHAEAGEQHLGVAVGTVVAVAVGIEQQVRGLEDEHAPMAECQPAGQVQPGQEVVGPVGPAVAVGVLEDRHPVGPSRPARGRLGHLVVDRPRVPVHLHPLQPRRVGILEILDHPEPAPVVELDRHGLPDHRLGREEPDLQAVGRRHPARGFHRGVTLRPNRSLDESTRAKSDEYQHPNLSHFPSLPSGRKPGRGIAG